MISSLFRIGTKRTLFTTPIKRAEIEVFINGKSVMIEQGSAVIQACEKIGVEIPRFCYHERLSVAGNCRMCLVEVEKVAKPIASCAMPVQPGMKIKTNTPLVNKAREGVMEFLLANHPLDCPVCDQGGECDLQDQSMRYGSDRSRLNPLAGKRAVEDKNFGPLVKTVMTRCIQCTRCVRFATEVAGASELGTSGRGNDMQIGTYIESAINSEMSGNIIDLCPVGALTSKPYAFTSRPWELKRTESIDVLDAVGSNIRVDSRGGEVMRILPRLNDDINEEWINDKTRFAYDGLKRQRLTSPLKRQDGKFVPISWPEALETIAAVIQRTKPENMSGVAGQLADVESMVVLKDLFNTLGSESLRLDTHHGSINATISDFRSNYIFNTSINGVENADWILLVGTNPRHEAAIINTRIRKSYLNYKCDIGVIGEAPELNYAYDHVGTGVSEVNTSHPFMKKLEKAKRPLIIVGSGVYERPDASGILGKISKFVQKNEKKFINDEWKGYNVLQRAASHTGAYEIGFTSYDSPTKIDFLYLLNTDDISAESVPKDAFVVYQGHHGDVGAQFANIILPGAAYTEKNATYMNTEGRSQMTRAAVTPPGAAREDWKILRALSELCLPTPLLYETHDELRQRMGTISPGLIRGDSLPPILFSKEGLTMQSKLDGSIESLPLEFVIKDFYQTDSVSRNSKTMAKCSKTFTFKEKSGEERQLINV